jgi:hypothetical protein
MTRTLSAIFLRLQSFGPSGFARTVNSYRLQFVHNRSYRGIVPSAKTELNALKNLISEADLIPETTPALPQNRTGACRENLRVALALIDDLIIQTRLAPAAVLGHKGGSTTSRKFGLEHYRKMAAARKTRGGGRPRKEK